MRRTPSFQIARDRAEEFHLAFGLSIVDGLYYVGTDAELDKVAVVVKQSWERGDTMSEHSPGPWIIKGPSSGDTSGTDDGGDYAIVADNQIIAEAIHRTDETIYQPALANALLIVQSPVLLEFAKEIMQLLEDRVLLRNTESDSEPGWILKAGKVVGILKRGSDAIAQAEKGVP